VVPGPATTLGQLRGKTVHVKLTASKTASTHARLLVLVLVGCGGQEPSPASQGTGQATLDSGDSATTGAADDGGTQTDQGTAVASETGSTGSVADEGTTDTGGTTGGGGGSESSSGGTPLGDVGSGATVAYVGKVTDVWDFSAATGLDLGTHGYYFPQFGQSTPKTDRPSRDNMQFSKPTWQKDWEFSVFETCGGQFCNLFSPDAGVFDLLEGDEGVGVHSASEGDAWAFIQFTGGSGNSGSVVDEAANGNTNNSVNHIRMDSDVPAEFCMSILTDNTAGAHDIHQTLAGRIGWYQDVDLEVGTAQVPAEDLVYNGIPDLYVFRYSNMTDEDFIKIRLNGGEGTDPGFGGLMFDPCD